MNILVVFPLNQGRTAEACAKKEGNSGTGQEQKKQRGEKREINEERRPV